LATLHRSFGREAFGGDPVNYDSARPPYPEATWQALRQHAGLRPGIDILEIGAGTGLATRSLLAHQPSRLVAIEPDGRLAGYLRAALPDHSLAVVAEPFETAGLPDASVDLVACATAFHWLDSVPALVRIRTLLRPGGHVGLWWNVFGEPGRPDAFHDATAQLFTGHPTSPSGGGTVELPFGLDTEARLADFAAAGLSADPPQLLRWTLRLDTGAMRRLYATYSNVTALPAEERERLLDGLAEVAERQFGGVVERNLTTSIYTARR
jgi:SAM-dependent methyltransferase